jgi:hypothetical protein
MAIFENQPATPEAAPQEPVVRPIELKAAEGKEGAEAAQVQQELTDRHMKRFQHWSDWRSPLENIWTEIYRLFFAQSSGVKLPTRAKIVLPIVFQVIESALPKLVTVIFGQPDWFSAQSRSKNNPVPAEILTANEDLLRYQFELADFFVKFIDWGKQLFMYGTSYFYVYWKVKREWVYERVAERKPRTILGFPMGETLTWTKKLSYKVTEQRPEVEVLNIEDVYPDPDARNEQNSQGVYIATSISLEDLKELSTGDYPCYANYDEVEKQCGGENKYEMQQFKVDKRSIRGTGEVGRVTDPGKMVELITFWGKEDLDGDGIREEVQLVFANRKTLIKAKRNPFEHQKRPLVRGVLFPVPNEWFGMGLIEPVIGLIHELVTIRNQNIDMNNLIINRMWKVHSMADVDLDTLVSSPNGIIVTGDMDGLDVIGQEPIPVSPLQMSELIQTDIENTTAPKSLQGTPQGGTLGRTARGAQLIISQALEKFGMGALLVEKGVLSKVLTMFKQLNEQFLDSDEVLQEFYGPVVQDRLAPEDIRADMTFTMLGISETVTREAVINQIIAYVNVWKGLPGLNLSKIAAVHWDLMQMKQTSKEVVMDAPMPQTQVMNVLQNPDISAGTEEAIVKQVSQNGSGGAINPPA